MLTSEEMNKVDVYAKKALESIQDMKELISYFESPLKNMTWGEFSRAMHRNLLKYDDSAKKIEAIYKLEFHRMFGDDGDDEE